MELPAARSDPSPDDWLHRCLQTVISADNPFIPGMTLSVLLSEHAEVASEGEPRMIASVRERTDALLLEELERLPKAVRGFPGSMEGCIPRRQPEGEAQSPRYLPGPLIMARQKRLQMEVFCSAPLVMDFLSLVFQKGLPDLRGTKNLREDSDTMNYLRGQGHESPTLHRVILFAHGVLVILVPAVLNCRERCTVTGDLCRCINCSSWSTVHCCKSSGETLHPTQSGSALRTALDFLIYVGMLAFFSSFVLLYEEGDTNNEEGAVLYEDA